MQEGPFLQVDRRFQEGAERFGEGQIILFSGEPNFRGSSLGTNRLWLNAIVYGAGLGTSQKVSLD